MSLPLSLSLHDVIVYGMITGEHYQSFRGSVSRKLLNVAGKQWVYYDFGAADVVHIHSYPFIISYHIRLCINHNINILVLFFLLLVCAIDAISYVTWYIMYS
jgi:hypothetical protein